MEAFFITDSHSSPLATRLFDLVPNDCAAVIHGGDFSTFTTAELDSCNGRLASEREIEAFRALVPRQIRFLYVTGNHDWYDAREPCKIQLNSVFQKLSDKWFAIFVPGSHSVQTRPLNGEPYSRDLNFWEGYPHGPLQSDARSDPALPVLFEAHIESAMQHGVLTSEPLGETELRLGESQYDIIRASVAPGERYVVISHQGPFYSHTSLATVDGITFSSGSFGVQRAVEEFCDQIALVVHGHTHQPRRCEDCINGVKIINPGTAKDGRCCTIEMDDAGNVITSFLIGTVNE